MQEAYRPWYSICFPRWGTPLAGVPLARSDGGVPKGKYPLARSDVGVPEVGYPPAGVPLSRGLDLAGVPPVNRQMDGWIDRHVWKHYLPVVVRTRSVTNQLTSSSVTYCNEDQESHNSEQTSQEEYRHTPVTIAVKWKIFWYMLHITLHRRVKFPVLNALTRLVNYDIQL